VPCRDSAAVGLLLNVAPAIVPKTLLVSRLTTPDSQAQTVSPVPFALAVSQADAAVVRHLLQAGASLLPFTANSPLVALLARIEEARAGQQIAAQQAARNEQRQSQPAAQQARGRGRGKGQKGQRQHHQQQQPAARRMALPSASGLLQSLEDTLQVLLEEWTVHHTMELLQPATVERHALLRRFLIERAAVTLEPYLKVRTLQCPTLLDECGSQI
jgi:hypothetical protein